ncbi:MAG: hypothetical protein M0Z53_10865 [Thermaerobacter sp.]|nr:hypothetical protein [Thermaerobacter sp.]
MGDRYRIPPLARKAFLAGFLGNPDLKPQSQGGWHQFLEREYAAHARNTHQEADQ